MYLPPILPSTLIKFLLFSALSLLPLGAAENLIPPSGITATAGSTLSANFGADNLLDELIAEGDRNHLNNHWLSAQGALTETVTFDLGGTYKLTRFEVLNTSNSNWNDSTTETFTLSTSTDGTSFSSPSSPISLQLYPAGFQNVPVPAGTPDTGITHVRLVATAVSGSVRVGLNEVRIYEDVVLDSDSDGMLDAWEIEHFGDLSRDGTEDEEGDSLTNQDEHDFGTDPNDADSDDDNLTDGDEVLTHLTDPNLPDTDHDGLTDADEIVIYLTDPTTLGADSDNDGTDDGAEVLYGTNPNSGTSTPPANYKLTGLTSPGTIAGGLDGLLPPTTPGGGAGTSWAVQDAFPSLSFADLKGVVSEPNSNFIGVVERRGTVQRVEFNSSSTVKTQILDIQSKVDTSLNGGLRTVVFHPEYNQVASTNKDYLYVFYTSRATAANGFTNPNNSPFLRLSRFTRNPATGLIPSNSELVMIQQRTPEAGAHFSGGLVFGKDGFLYISWGDHEFTSGTVGVPFYQDSQRIDRIFQSAVICIDVDQTGGAVSTSPTHTLQGNTGPNAIAGTTQSCVSGHAYYHTDNHSGLGYNIPLQNYWHKNNNVPPPGTAGTSDGVPYPIHGPALEEHVAIGMRNPWRLAADPVDGDIAWFSVGSNRSPQYEEVEVLVQGGNYGWPYREANISKTFETGRDKPPGLDSFAPVYLGTETDPVYFYPESQGTVSVGGVMYRGTTLGGIGGTLISADHGTGKIWSIDYKGGGTPIITELIDTSLAIRQMTPSPNGEDILIAANGNIHLLTDTSPTVADPPATLSATGFFSNLANLTPRSGTIPYDPISPLWSDRAHKFRFFAVPNDQGTAGQYDDPAQKIIFSASASWAFPTGTVFVKHFTVPLDEGEPDNPSLQHKVETRFLVHGDDSKYYSFTYKWRNDQTDADLIPKGDASIYDLDLTVTREDDSTYTQTWAFPSRAQCFDCHQQSAGTILGLRSRQLNSDLLYPTTSNIANQLTTMNSLAMFDQTLNVGTILSYLKSAHITDTTSPIEHRVHSYLDSNCSHCHHPGGNAGQAVFDARLTTDLSMADIIDVAPRAGLLGLTDPRIVKPGDPANSVLFHRDASGTPSVMMPPLARSLQDSPYIDVLEDWIERIGRPNFDSWASTTGINGGLEDDQDGDQLSNGFEFLLGTDGLVPNSSSGITVSEGSNGNPEYRISLNGDALSDGLTPFVQDSINLEDWYGAGSPNSILFLKSDTSGPGVDGVQTWEFIPGTTGFTRTTLSTP